MTKESLVQHLLRLPTTLQDRETSVLLLEGHRLTAARNLQEREDDLLLNGVIDGKNAELREAQVRRETREERQRLENAGRELDVERLLLRSEEREFSAMKAIARLMAGKEA